MLQGPQVLVSRVAKRYRKWTKRMLQMLTALAESVPEGLSTLALEVLRDMNAPDLDPGIGYARLRKEVNTWKHEAHDAEMDAMLRRSRFSALGTAETPSERKHTSKQVCRLLQLIQHRRHMCVMKSSSGKLLFTESQIADELISFWSGIMTPTARIRECVLTTSQTSHRAGGGRVENSGNPPRWAWYTVIPGMSAHLLRRERRCPTEEGKLGQSSALQRLSQTVKRW